MGNRFRNNVFILVCCWRNLRDFDRIGYDVSRGKVQGVL